MVAYSSNPGSPSPGRFGYDEAIAAGGNIVIEPTGQVVDHSTVIDPASGATVGVRVALVDAPTSDDWAPHAALDGTNSEVADAENRNFRFIRFAPTGGACKVSFYGRTRLNIYKSTDSLAGHIAGQFALAVGGNRRIDLRESFQYDNDPRGLGFSASSSDATKATAVVNGNALTVTGVAAGTTNITVTATAVTGQTADRTIAVTVA